MQTILKWTSIVFVSLVLLVALAVVLLYAASQHQFHRTYSAPQVTLVISHDPASISNGKFIAITRGCSGCHNGQLQGQILDDDPWLGRLVTPNISQSMQHYSDAQLARLLRYGVRPDGTSVIVMPSSMFYYLTDEDLADLIAYLRTVPPVINSLPKTQIRILGKWLFLTGKLNFEAAIIEKLGPRMSVGKPAPTAVYGDYLVHSSCTECHGWNLQGNKLFGIPDLVIAKSYTPENFARLMSAGIGNGNRDLGLMSAVAKERFSHFDNTQVTAIYAYLQSRSVSK
jgi:cytochrome c553